MLFRVAAFVLVLSAVAAARPSQQLTRAFEAGVDAYRLGKLDEARRHLERARQLDPKLPGPHRFLAAVAQAEGRWQDCIDAARHAIELNPRSKELDDTRKLVEACRQSAGRAPYPEPLGERAAIAVMTSVPGATVTIGGLAYGGTPLAPRTIPAGVHEVELAKAGYLPQRISVRALAGIVTDVIVELEPDPAVDTETDAAPAPDPATRAMGTLALTIDPAASVRVDGTVLASSNGPPWPVTPGDHVVEVHQPGKDVWRRRVTLGPGEAKTLVPDLIDTAARQQQRRRGWILVGTGGGLLAAAGGTGVLALREDGSARTGFLVGAGASLVAGGIALGLGTVWIRRSRAPDPDEAIPYAVVPVEGGAVITRGGWF